MKSKKKVEKDPIKDKYNQKIGFFKKIQILFINFYKSIKSNKDIMDDIKSMGDIMLGVVLYGLLGSLFMTILGFDMNIINILGIGSGLWLIENKFTDIITRILGSIKIVDIRN